MRNEPSIEQRIKCRAQTTKMINNGTIPKEPCMVCGSFLSQGHHPDYFDPTRVEWLCQKHHSAVHSAAHSRDSIGGLLRQNKAKIHGHTIEKDGDCWNVLILETQELVRVPVLLKRSWVRYWHRGPRGRRKNPERSIRITLSLPKQMSDILGANRQKKILKILASQLLPVNDTHSVRTSENTFLDLLLTSQAA